MSILDMANWLTEHGYMDNMVYCMSDAEITALYQYHYGRSFTCCEG
jgi:hypothetical protein